MSRAFEIVKACGGSWRGTYGLIAGPGHSKLDRSVSVRDRGGGDVVINSFARDDWREVRDALRRDGLLPDWEPGSDDPAERERADRERHRANEERERARELQHRQAATRAEAMWHAAKSAYAHHPYVVRKRLNPPDLKMCGEALLVPMRDGSGRIWNLQRIFSNGSKRFLAGARVDGLAWHTGEAGPVLAIGEGMATMAAVHAATGLPVVAAMTCANLAPIARAIRANRPTATLIVCADDDAHRPDNPGLAHANAAAHAVDGLVSRPPRPPGWPDGRGWDFADTWLGQGGPARIRRALTIDDGGAQ